MISILYPSVAVKQQPEEVLFSGMWSPYDPHLLFSDFFERSLSRFVTSLLTGSRGNDAQNEVADGICSPAARIHQLQRSARILAAASQIT